MYQEDNYLPINCHLYPSHGTFEKNLNRNSTSPPSSLSSSSNAHSSVNHVSLTKSTSQFRTSVLHCTEEMIQNLTNMELETIKTRCKLELENIPKYEPPDHWATPHVMTQIRNMKYFPDVELNELMVKLLTRVSSFRRSVTHTIVIFLSSESFKDYYLPNQIMDDTKKSKAIRLPHPWYKLFHLFWQQFDLSPELNRLFKKVINEACYKLSFVPDGEWKGKFRGKWSKSSHRQSNPQTLNASYGNNYFDDDSSNGIQYQDQGYADESSRSSMSFEVLSDEDYVPPSNSMPPLNAVIKFKKMKPRNDDVDGPEENSNSNSSSSSASNVNSDVSMVTQATIPSDEFFTPGEVDQIRERLNIELSFSRTTNSVHWASRKTQNRVRKLNFFSDPKLNSKFIDLLLKIRSLRSVIFSTMVVFYGLESFKKFYLPCHFDLTKNSTAHRPPMPKFKLFHQFWRLVHGQGTTPLRIKRILNVGNFHLRRVPDGKWKGMVVQSRNSKYTAKAVAMAKQSDLIRKIKQRTKLASRLATVHTSGRQVATNSNSVFPNLAPLNPSIKFQPSTSGSSQTMQKKFSLPQLVPLTKSHASSSNCDSFTDETGDYLLDERGNTYILSKSGNPLYVYVESSINTSYGGFFKPSRLLLMKARAYTILHRSASHLLNQKLESLARKMKYAPEATDKILNLNYFPDARLNDLMSRILFADHSITRQVKWTASVFWSEEELAGSALIPGVMPFIRIKHEPIIGYLYYHQFWDLIVSSSRNEDRRRTLRSAIGEVYRERCKKV